MRRLRIACAVTVLTLAGFAVALKLTAVATAHAQNKASVSGMPTASAQLQAGARAVQPPTAAAITIATNISERSLGVEPQSPIAANASSAENSSAAESALLFLTDANKGNRIFTLAPALNSPGATNAASSAVPGVPPAGGKMTVFAGQAAAGSLGDGGPASSAEFDLKLDSLAMRSGVVVAPDGTIFIADTLNGTIRSIAGAASSEPGIVRSIAGRFGPRQNVDLVEPLGLALDRAGNLYIADRGANAVLMLHAAASATPGVLEILAHVSSPAGVGVTLDGSKVFAASPDTGTIVEIDTKTRSISTAGISPSQLFVASPLGAVGGKIIPAGLALDGAGNVFVSFSGPGGGLDQIWRLDATSGKVSSAARGFASPGELAFDSNGNLFVADQGTRRLLELRGAGVPANGVTLTPPAGPVPTDFGLVPIDGKTAAQSFTLTNNSGATISQIGSAFQGTNPGDFSVLNTTCAGTLLTDMSCAFNVVFSPQSGGARSASLAVTYTLANAQNTLTAAVSGAADDYQIMTATDVGPIYQLTINAGSAATFLLQVVPDDTFSGPVTLNCPVSLPVATTCGISAGTTVTTPLVPSLTVNVTAGTPVPFNITFQTTAKNGSMTAMVAAPAIYAGSGGSNGPGVSAQNFARFPAVAALAAFAILCATFAPAIFRRGPVLPNAGRASMASLGRNSISGATLVRLISTFALLVICAAALSSCGGGSGAKPTSTPSGKFDLMVQGTAQNAVRGFTVTLVVN